MLNQQFQEPFVAIVVSVHYDLYISKIIEYLVIPIPALHFYTKVTLHVIILTHRLIQ